MENKKKTLTDNKNNVKDGGLEVSANKESGEQMKSYDAIDGKEKNILEVEDVSVSKIQNDIETQEEKTIDEKENEVVQTGKALGQSEKTDPKQDEKDKVINLLDIPKVDETDAESQAFSDVSSIEDSAVRDKKEKEEKVMANYKNMAFPKHPRSMIKTELLVKDVKRFIQDMKKKTAPEDLDVRIIPSNMACRFELPLDLTRLKDDSPLSYLRKYCRVTESRKIIYKEKFHQFEMDESITVLNLQKIYETLYHESGLQDDLMHLQRLLSLDLSMELDVDTFIAVSCFMERIMLKTRGKGPAQGYKKNVFEETSFSALNGKLQGIDISPNMMDLLKYIRGT